MQESDLGLGRELSNLIQKDRAAFGQLEASETSLNCACERAFSCPNSSEGINDAGIAAQFTLTKARAERFEPLWIARAISSLPVPVSP